MNDFVRDKFTDKNGGIPLYGEILSGACVSLMILSNTETYTKMLHSLGRRIASDIYESLGDCKNPSASRR